MQEVAWARSTTNRRSGSGRSAIKGSLRHAWVPVEPEPVKFGTHGAVAAHYGAKEGSYEPHATTLDYLVAAAAG